MISSGVYRSVFAAAIASVTMIGAAHSAIIISEVHPSGSGSGTYNADWFELTNTGSTSVSISGWKIDDNSNAFGTAVALRGVTSIAAGQSVVFIEGNTSGSNDATLAASFISAWFGGSAPAGFAIGGYGGSGVGLSSSADAVNIFDAGGTLITRVEFGAATAKVSFDNAAGLSGPISQLSVVGVNGAFTSAVGGEVGSPGAIPAPASLALAGLGVLAAGRRRRA